MTKKIPLQNGGFAIVDAEVYGKVKQHIWHWDDSGNGVFRNKRLGDKYTLEPLSAYIRGEAEKEKVILRKNLNVLDYRKNNLVEVSLRERSFTKGPQRNNTSGYKGVTWDKSMRKWAAYIRPNGIKIHLGYFTEKDVAAKAYNEAVRIHFGAYGYLNIIGEDNRAGISPDWEVVQRRSRGKYFRGVSKTGNSYRCGISHEGVRIYLGNFKTPEAAAKAYDKKAYGLYGDKAILNFPEEMEKLVKAATDTSK